MFHIESQCTHKREQFRGWWMEDLLILTRKSIKRRERELSRGVSHCLPFRVSWPSRTVWWKKVFKKVNGNKRDGHFFL